MQFQACQRCGFCPITLHTALGALTLLVVRQEEHAACKKLNYVVVCLERRDTDRLHMAQLISLHQKPRHLASFTSRLDYLSGTGLPELSWKIIR